MFCTACGHELPDDANFCLKCGKALRGVAAVEVPVRWEYKDVRITLPGLEKNIWTGGYKSSYNAENLILQRLQEHGKEGWQADEPTDYRSLDERGRIHYEYKGFWGLDRDFGRPRIVTIRLKRAVR